MSKQTEHKHRLSNRFRFSVSNDTSHEILFAFRAKGLAFLLSVVIFILFLVLSVAALISYTPLRHIIPGYPSAESKRELVRNAIKLDSLQNEVNLWKQQLTNIQLIVTGKEPQHVTIVRDSTAYADSAAANSQKWADQEKQLRKEVEAKKK